MSETQLYYQWNSRSEVDPFTTAVSLHSHSMHSKESLGFLKRYAHAFPVVREAVEAQERRYLRKHGRELKYEDAYWTPPLSEREAMSLEQNQVNERLRKKAIVSLTDHDNIDAACHLHLFEDYVDAPISVEWTVPYARTFFHLGVHNLPPGEARAFMARMAEFTAEPAKWDLREILDSLSSRRDILIVFNHPLWDEKQLGKESHWRAAGQFIQRYGPWLHALELNGMRPWSENQCALALADAARKPVVSGGDRHGAEPNVVLNLTNAATFSEFAVEIRRQRQSTILVLEAYRAPHRHRYFETIRDVMRDYPEHTGRVRWTDRFYFKTATGTDEKLSAVWSGDGPGVCAAFLSLVRLMSSTQMSATMRHVMRDKSEVLP